MGTTNFDTVAAEAFIDAAAGIGVGVTSGSGAPAGDPGEGNRVYLDTATGDLYTWDGAAWATVGGSLEGETSADATVLGVDADPGVGTTDVTVIGNAASVGSDGSVAIGARASAADYEVVIGTDAAGDSGGGVVVGSSAQAGTNSTAVGKSASAAGATYGVAIGAESVATADGAVAIGATATVEEENGVAIGYAATAGEGAVAIGAEAQADPGHVVFAAGGEPILDLENDGGTYKIGFLGATPIPKPEITGSKAGNAALENLILALADLGLVSDGTT